MLWTVISQADVFYQAAQGSRAPRSSNPFDYLNNGTVWRALLCSEGRIMWFLTAIFQAVAQGSHLGTPGV